MPAGQSVWVWNDQYHDYYCVTYDLQGRPVYHWARQAQVLPEQAGHHAPETRSRHDSVFQQDNRSSVVQMPDPAPSAARTLQDFIPGTPNVGWYEPLDSGYRMRTGAEALAFFVEGRVFAMLYTETASETSASQRPNDDAYTVVRFGEKAHTNIRRFVVVEVKRGFVNACGIGTYSGRGALKGGCDPSEHTIVYFSGTNPASCYIPGEYEKGMDKEPIEVQPAEAGVYIRPESRIRFGKTYPIEKNVKVKDIGRVHPGQLSTLIQYWESER